MYNKKRSLNIVTLGCSKNLVDSEYLLQQLKIQGYTIYHDAEEISTDIVILNTCGFILDAKQESIDHILSYAEKRSSGQLKKLLVMGCLSERYREELENEIPEVDAFFGVWDHLDILKELGATYQEDRRHERHITTPAHYAYLKISEGCNRQCSFCAIPGIRGKQRSKSIEDLYAEALHLAGQGVKELILIAQDLSSYGSDLEGKDNLALLLNTLGSIRSLHWIRLHYAYPTGFPETVIDLMASHPKICRYIDIPIQHINDRILRSMNRGHDRKKLEILLNKLRSDIPGVAIRTTMLVGYPGESHEEFLELLAFIEEFKFERLGVFPYSHEEDTPAAVLKDDVPEETKHERLSILMAVQQQLSLQKNQEMIGSELEVLIDREEDEYYVGRSEFDSPEVDNEVLIKKDRVLAPGDLCHVVIESAEEFDLYARIKKG